jgi:DNA-binding transcriptional LysR family regulator
MILSDRQVLIGLTIAGLDISQLLDRTADHHVVSRKLIQVLPSSEMPVQPVHALIPIGQKINSATRAVLNHLAENLR